MRTVLPNDTLSNALTIIGNKLNQSWQVRDDPDGAKTVTIGTSKFRVDPRELAFVGGEVDGVERFLWARLAGSHPASKFATRRDAPQAPSEPKMEFDQPHVVRTTPFTDKQLKEWAEAHEVCGSPLAAGINRLLREMEVTLRTLETLNRSLKNSHIKNAELSKAIGEAYTELAAALGWAICGNEHTAADLFRAVKSAFGHIIAAQHAPKVRVFSDDSDYNNHGPD